MSDNPQTYPQCPITESQIAVLTKQVEQLVAQVDRLNGNDSRIAVISQQMTNSNDEMKRLTAAIMGNGKPGLVNDINTIKTHIGFNQTRTIHERMTSIEDILVEMREANKQSQNTIRSIVMPLVEKAVLFIAGGVVYVVVTHLVK